MKRKIFILVALIIAATGLMAQTIITTPEELHNVRDDLSGDYILGNDIDLDPSGLGAWYDAVLGWEPIGIGTSPFAGTFDGDGYTISNLTIDRPAEYYVGLFGYCGSDAIISNVTLAGADVEGYAAVGILVGELCGSMYNCSSSGAVVANQNGAGGLIGQVIARGTNEEVVGCYSDATVSGDISVGGLIGPISTHPGIGYRYTISNCGTTGNVTGNTEVAGFAARIYRTGIIQDCYASGDVTSSTGHGGFLAHIEIWDITTIENCYAISDIGSVTSTQQPFIGNLYSGTPTISNCYYNQDINGVATNGQGTGRTTAEMTYPYASNTYETWDFSTPVWVEDPHYFINDGYPFLQGSGLQTVITTPEELHNTRYQTDENGNIDGHFILGNDIDMDPAGLGPWYDQTLGWDPLGDWSTTGPWNSDPNWTHSGVFTGTFDGAGYTISNLTIDRPVELYVGFIGVLASGASITGVNIQNADVAATNFNVGILIGECHGDVDHCSTSGQLTGSGGGSTFYGGLIGTVARVQTDITISNCFSEASVQSDGVVGGLLGQTATAYGGALTVINSYATGSVTVTVNEAGGLIGRQYLDGFIYNCYTNCDISGANTKGGLIGKMYSSSNQVIENCYSISTVGGWGSSQPFIGSGGPTIINSYYNEDITGPATNGQGTGRTTEEMTYPYAANTYETWDFTTPIWVEDWTTQNNGYPWLVWQQLGPEDIPEPIITLEDPYYTDCGRYVFDVTVQDFTLVGALSLTLNYDPAILAYVEVNIPDADIEYGSVDEIPSAGTFKLAGYYDDPVTLGENDILLSLTFDVVTWGVSTDLTWPDDPSELNEVAGPNGELTYVASFFDVTFDIPAELALAETHVGVTCFGGSDGSIDLTVTGGEPAYSYAWTGPGGFTAATEDISGLEPGMYSVTVTDASGCEKSLTDIEILVLDDQPPTITTCPPDEDLEGCSTAAITGLAYSETLVEVTETDFTTAGGVATDNCTITYYAYQDGSAGTCSITVTRTWTLKDGMGNTTTCNQTITIDDTTPPEITACADDVDVYMNSGCEATGVDLGTPTYSDVCDPTPVATHDGVEPYAEGETTITWTVADACGNESTCTQTVTVHYNTLSGILTYHEGGQPLSSVELTLDDGVEPPLTATTDVDGSYLFDEVCTGTYTLSADFGTKEVGGINATDAALANYWGVAPWAIESVRFYAGDAAPNNYVDATDAGRVLTWFVQAGDPEMDNPWSFWVSGEMISANPSPPPSGTQYPEIIVGGAGPIGDLTQDLLGMVTGDFNKSYTSASKAAESTIDLLADDIQYVEPGMSFTLPIRAGMEMEVGALSLIFELPEQIFEVEQVYLGDNLMTGLLYNQTTDQLRTGWSTLAPIVLSEGDPLLTLEMKLLEPIDEGYDLSLADDPLNELADGDYQLINDAVLLTESLTSSMVGIGPYAAVGLTLEGRPNPFHQATTFIYSIPAHGKVVLDVYDLVGNRVLTLVNENRLAGKHQAELLEGSLAPGVYMANLKLDTPQGINSFTIKIINQ